MSFGIGLAIGLVLKLPLFPWMLSDGASTVFGSGAGALIGAGAAGLIAIRIAGRSERKARSDIETTLAGVVVAIEEFLYSDAPKKLTIHSAEAQLKPLWRAMEMALGRLNMYATSGRYRDAASNEISDGIVLVTTLQQNLFADNSLLTSRVTIAPDEIFSFSDRFLNALERFGNGFDNIAWRLRD